MIPSLWVVGEYLVVGTVFSSSPIGSMVLLYMVTWIPSIYPLYVSINIPYLDPMGHENFLNRSTQVSSHLADFEGSGERGMVAGFLWEFPSVAL